MSNKNYASPLRLEIKNSRWLIAAVSLMHFGALVMLLVSVLPALLNILLIIMVFFSWLAFVSVNSQKLFFQPYRNLFPPLKNAVWKHDGLWELEVADGTQLQAELSGNSFIHPWLTIVNLKLIQQPWYRRHRSLIFLPDNTDAESFRRLRVRLRQLSTKDPDNSPVPG